MPKVNAQVISWQICFLVTVDRDWVDVVSVGIRKYTTGTGLHHQLHWFEAGDPQARQVGRVSHQSRFIFQIVTFRSLVSLGHLPQLDGLIWKNSICVSKFSKKCHTKTQIEMLLIHEWFFSLLLGADNGHYIGDGGWGEGGLFNVWRKPSSKWLEWAWFLSISIVNYTLNLWVPRLE